MKKKVFTEKTLSSILFLLCISILTSCGSDSKKDKELEDIKVENRSFIIELDKESISPFIENGMFHIDCLSDKAININGVKKGTSNILDGDDLKGISTLTLSANSCNFLYVIFTADLEDENISYNTKFSVKGYNSDKLVKDENHTFYSRKDFSPEEMSKNLYQVILGFNPNYKN